MNNRLRELDFLRGLAIILVLFRHLNLFEWTRNAGWIGVDLFFVLSGFLVSGLLFRELIVFGNIKPALFLVRRGFKIYPVYYLSYLPYFFLAMHDGHHQLKGFLSDLTFTQNYVFGWGYAYQASWSLAVEEHFYFGLVLASWLVVKYKPGFIQSRYFARSIIAIMLLCLMLRIKANSDGLHDAAKLFTATHLRIDSLLAGVLIAYFYYFKKDWLFDIISKYKTICYGVIIGCLCWSPFIDPGNSFFVKTIGFSLLYTAFGLLLVIFLVTQNINELLDKMLSARVVNVISRIGFCSYSIYIIQYLVIRLCQLLLPDWLVFNRILFFSTGSCLSIAIGMIMTFTIEKYYLQVRNRRFPARVITGVV